MTNRTNLLMLLFLGAAVLGTATFGVQNAAAQRRPPISGQTPPGPWSPAPSQRSPLELGFGGSLNIPFDKSEEVMDTNASIHGTMLYSMSRFMKFEGDVGYWFLQGTDNDDENENADDPSLLTVTGGLRVYPSPNMHLDGGAGMYHFDEWQHSQDGVTTNYDAESNLGFYGGIGFELPPLDITLRAHYSDFHVEEFWNLGVSVRMFFPSGGGRGGRPRR